MAVSHAKDNLKRRSSATSKIHAKPDVSDTVLILSTVVFKQQNFTLFYESALFVKLENKFEAIIVTVKAK